jgi:hypothetical protein
MAVPIGMWVILAVGLALLIIAAIVDRRSRLRAEAELSALPQGRRLPRMSQDLCAHIDELLDAGALTVGAHLADDRAASHLSPDAAPTAVLEDARVVVCPEPLNGARLIQALLIADPDQGNLAIVTTDLDDFALGVALANHLQGPRAVVPVLATSEDCARITDTLASTATTTAGIRSGWLPAPVWGRAKLLLSDAVSTTVVPAPDKPSIDD